MRELQKCPINCARGRHYPGHPHLDAAPAPETTEQTPGVRVVDENRAPASVTGASDPASLAAQAGAAVRAETKTQPQIKSKEQREAEEKAARIAAMRPLARECATAPYVAIALATTDDRWLRLREERVAAMEQLTLNVMLAYGIDFSGKMSSIAALTLCHAQTIAEIGKQIYKEDKEAKRNAVTQNHTNPQPTEQKQ